jgi:hypothetical protein
LGSSTSNSKQPTRNIIWLGSIPGGLPSGEYSAMLGLILRDGVKGGRAERTFKLRRPLPQHIVQNVGLPPAVTKEVTVFPAVRKHELLIRGDLLRHLVVLCACNYVATIDDVWPIVVAHGKISRREGARGI